MEPTQPPTQPPLQTPVQIPDFQPKPNYFKTIIFSILIITTLGLIVYLIFQNQKLQKQVLNPPISPTIQVPSPVSQSIFPTPKTVSSISIPPDKTVGWKTYVNNQYGFSFKNPIQLEEINIDGSVTASNKTYLTKQLTTDVVVRIIYGWTEEKINPFNTRGTLSKQTINGIKWYLSFTKNVNEPDCYTNRSQTLTSDRKNTIEISIYKCPSNDNDINELNLILWTFKFIDNSDKIVTGKKLSYIRSIDFNTISVDLIEMINDNSQPNGYRIDNPSNKTIDIPVEQNVLINQITYPAGGNMTNKTVSLSDFIKIFESSSTVKNLPYWINIENGKVTKITEQYIP